VLSEEEGVAVAATVLAVMGVAARAVNRGHRHSWKVPVEKRSYSTRYT